MSKVAAGFRRLLGLPISASVEQILPVGVLPKDVESTLPRLDTEVEAEALKALLEHVEQCWRRLGESEPHWSVLTEPRFKSDRMAESSGVFYTGGEYDVRLFKEAALRCNVDFPSEGTCLELGCGVGRVTIWLARSFRHVIGVDISSSHLALAEQTLCDGHYHNVELLLVNRLEAFEKLPKFNAFFSFITLQHNPPPVMRWLLQIILSKLEPGGLGFFQLPTSLLNYSFDAKAYLERPPTHGQMEGHALPYEIVQKVLHETNCELLEARDHSAVALNSTSFGFLVRKI